MTTTTRGRRRTRTAARGLSGFPVALLIVVLVAGAAAAGCGATQATATDFASPSGGATPAATPAAEPSRGPAGVTAAASPTPQASASPAATPFRCTEARGTVKDYSYTSKAARTKVRYRVYFPPCYESSGKRFPYVVLMHGSDKDQTEWTRLMKADRAIEDGIAKGTLPPMILVMPGGGDLANTRIFTAGRGYESVVMNEIIPAVDKRFCTWGNRAGREIGGISRGGFWAFLMAFRHPEKFAAVGGHSPFFHPDNAPASHNPLDLAKSVKFTGDTQPRIWVDRGKQDYAEPGISPFVATLKARKIPGTYKLYSSGRHEVAYWASHVATYLAFYGKSWPRSYDALPDCDS